MKLTIHAAALAALIGAGMAGSAAATTIGSGKIYDVGKGSYSGDSAAMANDGYYCWAASASNLLQYWQDTYYDQHNTAVETPNGVTERFNEPYGTRYLDIYEAAVQAGSKDGTGRAADMIDWWFNGTKITGTGHDRREGSYTNLFGDQVTTVVGHDGSMGAFSSALKDAFAVQGQALGVSILAYNEATGSFENYHAVTCWGYEEDSSGNLSAIYLTDSDDKYFGAFRMEVSDKELVLNYYGMEMELGNVTLFSTDDNHDLYGHCTVYLGNMGTCTTYIDTPDSVAQKAVAPLAKVEAGKSILENVKLTGNETVYGSGVQFGDGKTAMIVSGDAGAGLSVTGMYDGAAGVTVAGGVLVSLENLESTTHENSGLVNEGKTYVHDGSVSLLYNMAMEGGAVRNSGYLEFKGCSDVVVAMNLAFGDGAGVYNEGSMSIRGNSSVLFMENSSLMGGAADIYNAKGGVVSIADNDEVYFMSGEEAPSIVNRGKLYLAAREECSISFVGSGIDSREDGAVYIGRDAMGHCGDMRGSVQFTGFGEGETSLTAVSAVAGADAAEFANVWMDASGISAVDQGRVSHADIDSTGALTFSNVSLDDVNVSAGGSLLLQGVTLNAANSIFAAGGGITLESAVINLADLSFTRDSAGSVVYDLGSVFTSNVGGSFTLTGYEEADSYVFTAGSNTDFARLCMDLLTPVLDVQPEETPDTPVVDVQPEETPDTPVVDVQPDVTPDTPVVDVQPDVTPDTPVVDVQPETPVEGGEIAGVTESDLNTPSVLEPLQNPELAVKVENAEGSVTLGGVDADISTSGGLTQTVDPADPATEPGLGDLDENAVTMLPDNLDMDKADMDAMADAVTGTVDKEPQSNKRPGLLQSLVNLWNNRRPKSMVAGMAAPHELDIPMVGNAAASNGAVPEPATGMLSLLAMAGLCARRRRK